MSATASKAPPVRSTTPRAPLPAWLTGVLWGQGLHYLLTGVWPLVSIETFQMVTGPKTDHLPTGREGDHWFVMPAGAQITSVAVSLLTAAWLWRALPETVVLAVCAAIGLPAIAVGYVHRQVIAPVYLADAVVEVMLVSVWAGSLLTRGPGGFSAAGRRP